MGSDNKGLARPEDRALSPVATEPEVSALSGDDPSRGFLLKAYRVAVDDFQPYLYYTASRGKALSKAWNSYCGYRAVSFKDFMRIARCWRETPLDSQFGQPITVGGKPAFFVTSNNQYVQFARPGATEYFNAHPYDVEPEHVRPWTYRSSSPTTTGEGR